MVVIVHLGQLNEFHPEHRILRYICLLAHSFCFIAPSLFFLISGFLYANIQAKGKTHKYLRRILLITVCGSLIYTLYDILTSGGISGWLQLYDSQAIADLVFVNKTVGTAYHLWYLYALIYIIVIMMIIDRHGKWDQSKPFIIALTMIGVAFYIRNPYTSGQYIRNFLFFGLPFFAFGRYAYEKQSSIKRIPDYIYLTIITFSILAGSYETLFIGHISMNFAYYFIPLCCSIFLLALKHPLLGAGVPIETIGSQYSAGIYVFHILIGQLLWDFVPASAHDTPLVFPGIVLLVTIFACRFI